MKQTLCFSVCRAIIFNAIAVACSIMTNVLAAKRYLFIAALGLTLFASSSLTSAKILRWNLENVTFSDGGTATGFFTLDVATGMVDWDIAVTQSPPPCPPCFPAFDFTVASTEYGSGGKTGMLLRGPSFYDVIGRNSLYVFFLFDTPLSDAGGTVQLQRGEEYFYYFDQESRSIVSGEVTAVPEPSPTVLLAIGAVVFGIGFFVRRTVTGHAIRN